jgi:thioredoxin 1
MRPAIRILGLVMIAAAVAAVIYERQFKTAEADGAPASVPSRPLPRLVDLGADYCAPCKVMAPMLSELATQYKDVLIVERVNVEKDKARTAQFRIKETPTQIFLAPDGKELYRHPGFMAKDEILAQWEKLGYDLAGQVASAPTSGPAKPKPATAPVKPAVKPGAS